MERFFAGVEQGYVAGGQHGDGVGGEHQVGVVGLFAVGQVPGGIVGAAVFGKAEVDLSSFFYIAHVCGGVFVPPVQVYVGAVVFFDLLIPLQQGLALFGVFSAVGQLQHFAGGDVLGAAQPVADGDGAQAQLAEQFGDEGAVPPQLLDQVDGVGGDQRPLAGEGELDGQGQQVGQAFADAGFPFEHGHGGLVAGEPVAHGQGVVVLLLAVFKAVELVEQAGGVEDLFCQWF